MSFKKIDTSADIIFGSLTLLEGFVILDLKLLIVSCYYVEETKIRIEAKFLKLILLTSRQSGISSNKQNFERIMPLWNILC